MIEWQFHPDMLLLLPQLAVTLGTCDDPQCAADHWRITLGWLVASVHLSF